MKNIIGLLLLFLSAACASVPNNDQSTNATGVLHITPVRPIAQLLPEALKAIPPVEQGEFLAPDLVEIIQLDPTIQLDIRYATSNNFIGTPVYSQARAFLQRPAAEALVRVQRALAKEGYGLAVYDGYRPWYITKLFWDAVPQDLHQFVGNPAKGSRHNRGCAVDLTLVDLTTGRAVDMPSFYDETTERAYPTYTGGTPESRRLRDLLRHHMEAEGFSVYPYEWWHFDYRDWKKYAIQNVRFEDIK